MSSTPLAEAEENVFDLTEVVPETERLDSSLQKAKAQLTVKTRRHRPSRSRLRDSLSSTEGEDSLDAKSYSGLLPGSSSPLYPSIYCSSPFCDLHPSSSPARRDRAFTFDPCPGTADSEKNEPRRRALLNTSSPANLHQKDHAQLRQEHHVDLPQDKPVNQQQENHTDLPKSKRDAVETEDTDQVQLCKKDHDEPCKEEDHVQVRKRDQVHPRGKDHVQLHEENHSSLLQEDHLQKAKRDLVHPRKKEHREQLQEENHCLLRQREHSQSEDDSHDVGSDEPSSPTVLLDKKTRRRFLDLGVTLWRTYGRVRKERASRHSAENRPETAETAESRTPRTSGPPFVSFSWFSERIRGSGSPKHSSQSPAKSHSEDEELKTKSRSSKKESSQPYQSLSDLSDEGCDDHAEPCLIRKKPILRFSSSGRDRMEKQNGIQRDKKDNGHDGDGQKLLTTLSQSKNYE
ncbi:sterile alpha motif domain-containing protein 14 [Trichomycterus rosablanca]|uniref:sterile alpha motif domain-containing protein 14 n=1 Tax=Trichomycterus rosablanca TaxID=2290929 RepID=UPI002F350C76